MQAVLLDYIVLTAIIFLLNSDIVENRTRNVEVKIRTTSTASPNQSTTRFCNPSLQTKKLMKSNRNKCNTMLCRFSIFQSIEYTSAPSMNNSHSKESFSSIELKGKKEYHFWISGFWMVFGWSSYILYFA